LEGDPSIIVLTILLVFSFALSTLFSVVKVVFSSIDTGSIPVDDEYLRFYASKVEHILENERLFKNTVSLGRTFANAGFAICGYMLFTHLLPHFPPFQKAVIPFFLSVLVLTLFAYDIPRALAKRFYRVFFSFTYTLYKIFSWLFLPLASLFLAIHLGLLKLIRYDERFSFLSDEDKARMNEKNNGEALDEEEKEMIRGIFDLGETDVDEIMVPRIDVKGIDITTPLPEILKIIREEGHSRLPVFKETIDSVVGVLYAKDILTWLSENDQENWNIEQLLKKPLYVPVGKKVNDLMRDFRKKRLHIAIAVDEYGGTAGLVTMEDILEEIVGDIQDEYDEEEKEVVKVSENCYLIDPHIDIDDLNDELGIHLELDDAEFNTLSGLIYHEYGDVPQENASLDFGGLHITILKMDNQRIDKVKVEIIQRNGRIVENSNGF
jgi:CBS domain containing-hemolysin-like protein